MTRRVVHRTWTVSACAVLAGVALMAGCADDGRKPTASETRVCEILQRIVDDLAALNNTSALATLPELELAVNDTENETLSASGKSFFDDLFTDIDYSQLTVSETAELGKQFQAKMAATLGKLIDECARVDATIERLPTS